MLGLFGFLILLDVRLLHDIPFHSLSLTRLKTIVGKRVALATQQVADEERNISKNYFIDISVKPTVLSLSDTFGNVRLFAYSLDLSSAGVLLRALSLSHRARPHRSFRLNEACENVVVHSKKRRGKRILNNLISCATRLYDSFLNNPNRQM